MAGKLKQFFERIISLTGIAVAILLLISWLCGFIDPRKNWIASILSLTFPYVYILAILIAFLGLLLKNLKAWVLIFMIIAFSSTFRKSFFNQSVHAHSTVNSFSLLTHNIGSSIEGNKKLRWAFYNNSDADILCFQEWYESINARMIKDSIIKHYKSSLSIVNNPWPIFSKYPIVRAGEIKSKAKGNGVTWADIIYKSDTIRIYNVHLVSNRISSQTEELMTTETIKSKNVIKRIIDVMKRYRRASILRVEQAKILKQHINKSPYPIVLAGDFNDIPSSYVYKHLQDGLNDTFLEAGSGMAYTYAGKLPFLHIDHVLYDHSFVCHDIQIKRENYSDHYPVKVVMGKK